MKKLILLLLFIPLLSFGQDVNLNVDKKIEFSEKEDIKKGLGLSYIGSGQYEIKKELDNIYNNEKRLKTKLLELEESILMDIREFCSRNNYSFKIKNKEILKPSWRHLMIITYEVYNKDGSLVLNKEDAKKQLIELKEYLDLGIITQEEFDTKAVSLKKILLGN